MACGVWWMDMDVFVCWMCEFLVGGVCTWVFVAAAGLLYGN